MAVLYAPFAAGNQLLALGRDDGGNAQHLGKIVSTSSTTDCGSTNPAWYLTFYRERVIVCDYLGVAAPQSYTGSGTCANLAGSPPAGSLSAVYRYHLVLANSAATTNRIWFSKAGDPTTWDTTYGWIDASNRFGTSTRCETRSWSSTTARWSGSPGTRRRPVATCFCSSCSTPAPPDPRSVAGTDQFCCFANESGVFMTDGGTVPCLTEEGGIKSFWQSRVATATAPTFAGGYYRGYYFVTIQDGTSTLSTPSPATSVPVAGSGCRTCRGSATRGGRSAARRSSTGSFATPRVCTMSGVFSPASGNKADGDGTSVLPIVETPWYPLGDGASPDRDVFLTYDIRDAASDDPTLTLSYILSPEMTSYTNVKGRDDNAYTIPETTAMYRVRRLINKEAFGIAFKILQTNPSSASRMYRIDGTYHQKEPSGVG